MNPKNNEKNKKTKGDTIGLGDPHCSLSMDPEGVGTPVQFRPLKPFERDVVVMVLLITACLALDSRVEMFKTFIHCDCH